MLKAGEVSLKFSLDVEKFETLAKLRGWTSKYSNLAEATGLTRSYVRRVILGQERMSDHFMIQYIIVSGANPDNPKEWGSLFKIIPINERNEMSFNYPKLRGHIPYKRLSLAAEMRRQDNPEVETR